MFSWYKVPLTAKVENHPSGWFSSYTSVFRRSIHENPHRCMPIQLDANFRGFCIRLRLSGSCGAAARPSADSASKSAGLAAAASPPIEWQKMCAHHRAGLAPAATSQIPTKNNRRLPDGRFCACLDSDGAGDAERCRAGGDGPCAGRFVLRVGGGGHGNASGHGGEDSARIGVVGG